MTIEAKGFKEGVLTNGSGYDYPDGRWRLKCPKGFSEPRGGGLASSMRDVPILLYNSS
ncbi:hypothetical protein Plhal304r1_c015g0056461 [Plasmopara halstedii]